MVGHPKAIDDAIEGMKKHGLILKVKDELNDYLSCEIKFSADKKKAWLGQSHLISNLEGILENWSKVTKHTRHQVHRI